MDPQTLIAQGRTMLIQELNIGHLTETEQNEILEGLSEMLLRRVLLKLFGLLPEDQQDRFQRLLQEENGEAAQLLVEKYVPDMQDVVRQELRAGAEIYKTQVQKSTS